jgi:hypothetical protein
MCVVCLREAPGPVHTPRACIHTHTNAHRTKLPLPLTRGVVKWRVVVTKRRGAFREKIDVTGTSTGPSLAHSIQTNTNTYTHIHARTHTNTHRNVHINVHTHTVISFLFLSILFPLLPHTKLPCSLFLTFTLLSAHRFGTFY